MGPNLRAVVIVAAAMALAPTTASAQLPVPGMPLPPPGGSEPPPPPPRPAATPHDSFAGIYADDVFHGSPGYRDAQLRRQAAIGVGVIRQPFLWRLVERNPGEFDWGPYDGFVANAAKHSIRVLPTLVDPPDFRALRRTRISETRQLMYPPKRNSDFAAFAEAAVRRYGPAGTFWAEHPHLPLLPIRAWQVWNEPNIKAWWASGPNARGYARLLRTVARGIRRADRGAEVVAAGIPDSRFGIPMRTFIARMYRYRARGAFDTLAIHPYSGTVGGVVAYISSARALMRRNRDRSRIWVTEVGWATGGQRTPLAVSPRTQARRIRDLVRTLDARRRSLRIRGFVLFRWRDAAPLRRRGDPWPPHAGILRQNGRAKPAYHAFKRAVGRLR